MLQQLAQRNGDDPLVQEMAQKLLSRLDQGVQEQLMELEKERDANIEAAQCKLVADSAAEVREVQRAVDAQVMEQEGEKKVEQAMQERMQQLREQRRRQLEERQRELGKYQDSLSAAQISNLKSQYEKELADLEAAIRREGAQQLTKMRKALLARKLKKEAKRKEQERLEREERERQAEEERKKAGKLAFEQAKHDPKYQASQETTGPYFARQPRPQVRKQLAEEAKRNAQRDEAGGEELLRLLLTQWSARVEKQKTDGFENIWDKRSQRDEPVEEVATPAEAPAPIESPEPKVAETGVIGDRKQAPVDYTMEELFRRIRRIEKLTRLIRNEGDSQGAHILRNHNVSSDLQLGSDSAGFGGSF